MNSEKQHKLIESILGAFLVIIGFFLVSFYNDNDDNKKLVQELMIKFSEINLHVTEDKKILDGMVKDSRDYIPKFIVLQSKVSVLESKH